ncbi:MAG: MFS transporter [Candidatus Diapherotrites archaeon]|nr:MFS transporter [Candidatus Diapherotrites archaeon]
MRRALVILLVAALLANFSEGIYTPLYAAYVEHIGGGLAAAGTSWSMNLIVYGILALVLSRAGAKYKHKVGMLITGYLLSALATALFAFVTVPITLYFVQGLRGFSWALLAPVWDSFYSLFVDRRHATVDWGYYEGGWSIANGLGAAFGGILITVMSFSSLFLLSASLNLLAAVLVFVHRREFEF